jgi:Mg2+/citrate symporter
MNQNIKNILTIIGIIIGLILIVYLNTIVAYVLVSIVLALIGTMEYLNNKLVDNEGVYKVVVLI